MDFHGKIKQDRLESGLDAEIDEFGDIQSLEIESPVAKFHFRRNLNLKAIERLGYDKTGISQLGTTYPNTYDREEFISLSKKPLNWYGYNLTAILATLFIVFVDFSCYLIMFASQNGDQDFDQKLILVAIGIAIAIDFLPIFFAHNLHRQGLNRKKVLKTFNIACIVLIIIFLVSIFSFRLLIIALQDTSNNPWSDAQSTNTAFRIANAAIESFIYMLVPCATSLLCFILNYLSYNPIAKKILKKKREILFKQEDINELKAVIKEMESKSDYFEILCQKDEIMYQSTSDMIDSISEHYKTYVRTEIMKNLHSPADTTGLSKH